MSHEWTLAKAFVGVGGSGRLHSSFVVSIVGVLLGVAFLILTLGVYDSYVEKLEAIAFTVYPHVLIVDGGKRAPADVAVVPDDDGDGEIEASLALTSDTATRRCERICDGEILLNPEAWTAESLGIRVSMKRVAELRGALAAATSDAVVAPVVLEEGELQLSMGAPADSMMDPAGLRPIRVLGMDPTTRIAVPRVDLVLSDEQMARLRDRPETIFLSSTLWGESYGGSEEPTVSRVSLARVGAAPVEMELGGTFELGFHAVAHNLLITSVSTARELLGFDDEVSYIGVGLDDPYLSRDFVEQIDNDLEAAGFNATDWTRIAGGDFESIRLFRWILFLVLGLSFVITALGMRNALAILTLERRRQIGILRALGLRDRSIRLIFLIIACGIGIAGTIPGAVLGSWLSVRFGGWLDRELAGVLPIQGVEMAWHPGALVQVLALVLFVCTVTSIVSVGRALQLDPVSCLREE